MHNNVNPQDQLKWSLAALEILDKASTLIARSLHELTCSHAHRPPRIF